MVDTESRNYQNFFPCHWLLPPNSDTNSVNNLALRAVSQQISREFGIDPLRRPYVEVHQALRGDFFCVTTQSRHKRATFVEFKSSPLMYLSETNQMNDLVSFPSEEVRTVVRDGTVSQMHIMEGKQNGLGSFELSSEAGKCARERLERISKNVRKLIP